MRVVLRETAHAEQSVQLPRFFVAVHDAQFAHTDGQIFIGMRLRFVHQNAAGAVHGFDGVIFAVDFRGVHIVFIMVPVSAGFPQRAGKHDGRGNFHISFAAVNLAPVIDQRVLQNHAVGQEEREAFALV